MKPISFRIKIALLSTLISGLVLLGFGVASWYLIQRQKIQALDTEIRSLGSRHPGWLANRGNFDRFNGSLEFIFGEEHKGQIVLLIKSADGKTLYTSPDWPQSLDADAIDCSLVNDPNAASLASNNPPGGPVGGMGLGGMGHGFGPGRGGTPVVFTKTPRFFTATISETSWRLGIMGNDDMRLVVGLNCQAMQSELDRMRTTFFLTFPLALFLVGGGGWLVAGRAMYPLNRISQMAEGMTAHGLGQRLPPSNEAPEIARLIHVLNGMMNRLESSFQQATRFSADASHELKTPLAIMQGELENALQAAMPGSPEQQVFTNLLEETQRLKVITRSLLLLAQADGGRLKLTLETMNLSVELEEMVEDTQILAGDSRLRFDVSIQPDLLIQADRGLLRMAIQNLLNNAIQYNAHDGSVELALKQRDDAIVLTVCNSGPGIDVSDQTRVFERFYRADPTHSRTKDGLGLGLSLAREIVNAHNGTLVLKESRPGHTCFELSLKLHREPFTR
jgi:heavy metal sensor kinase